MTITPDREYFQQFVESINSLAVSNARDQYITECTWNIIGHTFTTKNHKAVTTTDIKLTNKNLKRTYKSPRLSFTEKADTNLKSRTAVKIWSSRIYLLT